MFIINNIGSETRGSGQKLMHRNLHLNIRKNVTVQ